MFCFNGATENDDQFSLPWTEYTYKDRGGPAQLGTRDWAGLKGHGADRDLALYGGQKRAAPGEVRSHARWHRAPKSGI